MFNRKKIKELENKVFILENPNGKLKCINLEKDNTYNPYIKRDLVFEYELNKYIKLDSGYISVNDYHIEKLTNNNYLVTTNICHVLCADMKLTYYYLVNIINKTAISVDKDMKVAL